MITLAEASLQIRADMSKARADVIAGAKEAGRKGGQSAGAEFTGGIKSFAGKASSTMGILTSAVTGVGLAGLVTFGLKSAASLEQAQVGFTTLLHSGQRAQSFLAGLQKFAAATPFELPGLIDASRTLLGVGVSANQVIPMLTAFGDTAGAVGLGQEQFQRIMIATSQAIGAGKFQTADLNQIMNNGLPIWSILSKAMGKPVPVLRELASQGRLLSKDVLPILQAQMEKDYGGAMAKQSMTLNGVWSTLKDTVAIGLANALKPLVPLLSDFIPKAAAATGSALQSMSGLLASTLGEIRQHIGAIKILAVTVGSLVAAYKIYNATLRLVLITQAAFAAASTAVAWFSLIGSVRSFADAWALLDLAMDANPIGIVVVALAALAAGVTWLWFHSAGFRDFFIGMWHGIQAAASAVSGWFTGTFLPAMRAVWNGIAGAALWLWHNVFDPFWQGLVGIFHGIGATASWLMNFLRPVFAVIGWIVHAASAVIQLALAIVAAFITKVLAPVFMWLWHNIIEPTFNGIRGVVVAAVGILRATLSSLGNFVRGVFGPVFTWLWHNIIEPTWRGISGAVSGAYNFLRGIFKSLGDAVEKVLVKSFQNAGKAIGKVWDDIKTAALTPIKFVVNAIINPIIGGFNSLAKIFHTPTVSKIPGFAAGGQIPGNASSTDNRMAGLVGSSGKFLGPIRVATGEYIVNARDTAKALPILQWINQGMRGGPAEVSRRLGRGLTDMPGDGSGGWAFANGGLVGFLKDVWGAVSNPVKFIKNPIESMVKKIPGGGVIRQVLVGMADKLLGGFMGWIKGTGGGGTMAPGNVGTAQRFVMAQNGKPYVWASAGPGGYDCSGIVSAVYNVMKGRSPYSHTFSTESLPGRWFHEGMRSGPLLAGWSHPGESPASASVGHMAGMIGGLPFESSGSRGVHLGASARSVGQFAHIGSAYARGGLARLAKIAMADSGRVTLDRGWNLIGNGTGARERLATSAAGSGDVHFHFHGPVASKQAAKTMVFDAWTELKRDRKIS